MFIGVCEKFVCVAYRKCGFIFSPSTAQTCIIFTLLSVHFFLLYLQAENHGLSYCKFTFHFFLLLTLERKEEEEPKQSKRKIICTEFTGWVAHVFYAVFSCASYTGKKKRTLNYFGIDALVTEYQHFYSFCLFCFHFFLKQVPVVFASWPHASRYRKKVGLL